MNSNTAYAPAALSLASLQPRRLISPLELGKPKPEAMNLGVDKTS